MGSTFLILNDDLLLVKYLTGKNMLAGLQSFDEGSR
jgi:hypothetical protein